MKKLFFETEKDGFYGTYYENPQGSDCAVIGYSEMIRMIIWQNVEQNGYIKTV